MLKYMADQEIPELEQIKEHIATVEIRAQIRVKEHLGFGALHTTLYTKNNSILKYKYYGELNADGKEHGRGIKIYRTGSFIIRYLKNGGWSTGNYIHVWSDG